MGTHTAKKCVSPIGVSKTGRGSLFMAHKKSSGDPADEALAKVKKDAFRLLSIRARSIQELRTRLRRKGHGADAVESTLEYFRGQGLLDDEKFAKLYALSRLQSRPSGKKQIEFDLKTKGVPPGIVRQALGSLEDFDEKQIAWEAALKRRRSMKGLPADVTQSRLYGFLKRRGFTGEAVFYVLSRLYETTEGLDES